MERPYEEDRQTRETLAMGARSDVRGQRHLGDINRAGARGHSFKACSSPFSSSHRSASAGEGHDAQVWLNEVDLASDRSVARGAGVIHASPHALGMTPAKGRFSEGMKRHA